LTWAQLASVTTSAGDAAAAVQTLSIEIVPAQLE
jgi:hypothetical protein